MYPNQTHGLLPTALILSMLFFAASLPAQTRQPEGDSLIAAFTAEVNPDSIAGYVNFLQDWQTRFMLSPNRKEVANSIADKFIALGAEQVRIDSFLCQTVIHMGNLQYDTITWQYNVIGNIFGMVDSEDYYVMGAHYDDVVFPQGDPMVSAPGADDNASGVAALFETIRIFAQKEYLPVYSIEFVAFAAEELMYYGNSGSQAYVDTTLAHGKNLLLMINNDMISYTASDEWEIWISNYAGCETLTDIGEYVTSAFTGIEPVLRPFTDEAGADATFFYEAGVPSIYFMEKDFNPYYHTDNDLLENADANYCADAVKISIGVLMMAQDSLMTGIGRPDDPGFFVEVYPNPSHGTVSVKTSLTDKEILSCFLFDMQGRVVRDFNGRELSHLVLNDLPGGLYFLHVAGRKGTLTKKVLLSKH